VKVQKGRSGPDAGRIDKFTDATQELHTNLITFDFCDVKRQRMIMIMIHGHITVENSGLQTGARYTHDAI
jgi:hypothetical protein